VHTCKTARNIDGMGRCLDVGERGKRGCSTNDRSIRYVVGIDWELTSFISFFADDSSLKQPILDLLYVAAR
jgi:hypothetical protein